MNPIDIVRTVLRAILPAPVTAFLDRLAEAALAKLQGETVRAIGYGAAVVMWLATRIADFIAPGHLPLVTIDVAMVYVTAAIVLITELARRWAYSPATVAAIVANPPTAPGPIAAAVSEGVDPELIADAVEETVPVIGSTSDITEPGIQAPGVAFNRGENPE